MEVISIAGYTEMEKMEITKNHLIPKQIERTWIEKITTYSLKMKRLLI